ncbi:MAG: 30S ribosomal protein S3 [Planctomycetales bacterium]|nr:30S ribosomal protein S3 [Planctomycetales bacterium]
MGQKVWPVAFRVGVKIRGVARRTESGVLTNNAVNWRSRWYAKKKEFGLLVLEDEKIRRFVKKEYYPAGVSRTEIERGLESLAVFVYAARPGIIIGRKGAKVDKLKEDLESLTGKKVETRVLEVENPEVDAQLQAEAVAEQLERRASFRRTIKKCIDLAMHSGALGCRVRVSGRLGGAEIARSEVAGTGKIPLQTLRADVDYGFAEASTTYGNIGVKCWIYRGDLAPDREGVYALDAQTGQVPKNPTR